MSWLIHSFQFLDAWRSQSVIGFLTRVCHNSEKNAEKAEKAEEAATTVKGEESDAAASDDTERKPPVPDVAGAVKATTSPLDPAPGLLGGSDAAPHDEATASTTSAGVTAGAPAKYHDFPCERPGVLSAQSRHQGEWRHSVSCMDPILFQAINGESRDPLHFCLLYTSPSPRDRG